MFGHGSRKRVFGWDDRRLHQALFDPVKYLRRPHARYNGTAREHLLRRLVTERASFSLDRYFHDRQGIWSAPLRANEFRLRILMRTGHTNFTYRKTPVPS